ncbi:hypothetical protein ACQ4PT_035092 [Festuca glaucescens]
MAAAAGVGTGDGPLRVFFLPFFARGHLILMTDLGCRMVAARPAQVEATMVVTPANAALIAPTVTRAAVHLLLYPFPDVWLAAGVECLGAAPAYDAWRVHHAVDLAQPIHEDLLREHRPDAIVADAPFWRTTDVAAEIGVPRLTFHPVGVFPQIAMNNLATLRPDIVRAGDARDLHLGVRAPGVPRPGRPPRHVVGPDQGGPAHRLRGRRQHLRRPGEALLRRVRQPRRAPSHSAVHRGGDCDVDCLRWLSTKPNRSVVFVCFGSWAHFSPRQVRELALGLEASNQTFLWVVRAGDSDAPDGWEQRVAGRGMVVRGWAPQLAVLAHPSVAAFVKHCEWNSVLEAAAAGVPVLTWPLVFEQFINERLVTEVAAFGARVWDGGKRSVTVEDADIVPAAAIGRAVAEFMEGGERQEEMRARAEELAERARAAVSENGSSWHDFRRLIDDLMDAKASKVPP